MTTGFESNLRDGLRRLADAPPAPALADEALAEARRVRRRRRSLAALAAIVVVGVGTAVPMLLTTDGGYAPAGTGPTGTASVRPPVECRTATNEAMPPTGTVPDTWPSLVAIVLNHLPPRDDYHLSSAYGPCGGPSGPAWRMVMSVGDGQLVIELFPDFYQLLPADATPDTTCTALAAQWQVIYFCTDATPIEPLVVGGRDQRGEVYILALYPDGRWIILEDNRASLSVDTMRVIVTDPALAALLE